MGGEWRRAAMVAVGAVLPLVLLTGCAAGERDGRVVGGVQDAAQQRLAQGMADVFQPGVTVNPANGAVGVSPTERVTAVVTSGQFTQVDLRTQDGTKITGALSPDGERWTSTKPLTPDTSYVLTTMVRAVSGKQTTQTTRFSTLSPGQQTTAKIKPDNNATVAATEPVSVTFDKPVVDRVAVERALRVTSNPAVTGTAQWRGDRELAWRPTSGWPKGSRVTVSLDIFGKRLSQNSFGAGDVRTTFSVAGGADATAAGAQSGLDAAEAMSDPDLVPGGAPRTATGARLQPGTAPAGAGQTPGGSVPAATGAGAAPAGSAPAGSAPGTRSTPGAPAAAQAPAAPAPAADTAPSPATDEESAPRYEDARRPTSGLPVIGR